jgi:hypothetical protein
MSSTQMTADMSLQPVLENDPAHMLVPVKDYAHKQLPVAFENLEAVLLPLFIKHGNTNSFDVTAFYSKRRNDIPPESMVALMHHNQVAFAAAVKVGGFIIYYQGERLDKDTKSKVDPSLNLSFDPDCLSFCIWESRAHGQTGASVPEHRSAANQASQWYEHFVIKKYSAALKNKKISFAEYENTRS